MVPVQSNEHDGMRRDHMYKITVVKTLPLILVAAAAGQTQTVCSNATLKGHYRVQIAGTRPAPSVLIGIQATPGTIEQVAGVVVQIFDGAGGFTPTDNVKGSLSGIAFDRPGAGTYSVNPDCSGTFTVNNPGAPPILNRLVIVDNGQAFTTAVVSPQAVMVTATGKKMTYLAMCPSNAAPVLSAATDPDGSGNVSATGTIVVWGQGFTPSGGNSLVFECSGVSDVVLSESNGSYFWDYSTGQINASLGGLTQGTWTVSAH